MSGGGVGFLEWYSIWRKDGWFISDSKRTNGKIDQFLDQISLDHIVLETDAPYLAPAPFRGKRNQSEYLIFVLQKLADLFGKSQLEMAQITTKNAIEVFKDEIILK